MFGVGALICFALLLFLAYLWRSAAVEAARQELFSIRNEMFTFWAETGLPFNNPAYTSLREIMNHSIRYAHVITPSRCWLPYIWYSRLKKSHGFELPDYFSAFLDAVDAVDNKEIASALRKRHANVTTVLGRLYIFGSFSGWATVAVIFSWAAVKSIIRGGVRETRILVNNKACADGIRACNLALMAESN